MRLQTRLMLVLSTILVLGFLLLLLLAYHQERENILEDVRNQSRDIRALLMAVRRVYQHQFLESGISLDDRTLGFLPAHALTRISEDFANWSDSGVRFNNVSDRPRNPHNAADEAELKAMAWFRSHPEAREHLVLVRPEAGPAYYHYSQPIWIEAYCLKCHGRRADAPPTIRERYSTAFDYQLGDLRGLMSIKIPAEKLHARLFENWLSRLWVLGAILILIWLVLAWMLRRLVLSRLTQLNRAVERFAEGDYRAPVPIIGDDEFTEVARILKDMASRIHRREHDLERSRRLYHTLSETNQLILRLERPEILYGEVCRIAVNQGGFGLAWVGLAEGDHLQVAASFGVVEYLERGPFRIEGHAEETGDLAVSAYRQNRTRVCNFFPADPNPDRGCPEASRYGLMAAAALPLRVEGRIMGVFALYSQQSGFFTRETLHLLEEMAQDIAFAWNNYRREAELVHSQERIRYLAYHDDLTGLPNRALLHERLVQALGRCRRHGRPGALLHLNLDRFKQINASLGHALGDLLLRQVAQDLQSHLSREGSIARIGGDEFLVLAEELADRPEESAHRARHLAETLQEAVQREYALDGHPLRVTLSIGIALFPNDDTDADRLLRHAATAMHRAKSQGGNLIGFFDAEMETDARIHMNLERELHQALERDQFLLTYQPQVDAQKDRLIGFEVLLRWRHPREGLLGPDRFIGVLEETGLILPVGAWVTVQACIQLQRWRRMGLWREGMRLAINLSPRQLREADCIQRLTAIVETHDIALSWLEIEVTESMVIKQESGAVEKLKRLRDLGVKIALDDFGTGHSSLYRLGYLPVDTLKIDRSFVASLPGSTRDRSLVETIITIGDRLGMHVLAEGVETSEQRELLLRYGCTWMQGYLFDRPLFEGDASARLQSGQSGRTAVP